MAQTIALKDGSPSLCGTSRQAVMTVTFGTTYPTGGVTLTPATYGFAYFDIVTATGADGFHFMYNYTSAKLHAYVGSASGAVANEVAAATGMTGTVAYIHLVGR